MAATKTQVDIFTGAMRSEFVTAYEAIAAPAAFEGFTTTFQSNARDEHYAYLGPTPALDKWKGHRRVAKMSELLYTVSNYEIDAAFEVLLRDIADDKTSGYMMKAKELAQKAKAFPGREVLRHIALGKTRTCWDGSAFFASSHNLGSGPSTSAVFSGGGINSWTVTASGSSDAATCNIIALITTAPIKPLFWQQRRDPDLENDLDAVTSKFAKTGRFWVDMEGAPGFGRWHDAMCVTITNTPSITELQTYMRGIEDAFRNFTLPKSLDSDTLEYIHEQLEFSASTVTFLVSTNLGNLMRQLLSQDVIVQSGAAVTNIYKGYGKLVTSAIVNTVA